MAESSSADVTPKEEPVTLDRPKTPNPFLLAFQGTMRRLGQKEISKRVVFLLENGVQVDYAKIIWEDLIHKLNKNTKEKIVRYPSVHNWILKPNQPEEPPFTDHMKAICNLDVPVDSKAPKYSSSTKEVPQGKKLRDSSGLRRKKYSKHISKSTMRHPNPNLAIKIRKLSPVRPWTPA
uniref:Uncharacterized protein n=1 Tax=Tanacetum cinerariifolium TaxID=118510 RepID=A0A699GZH8_TANCI|nr:hypothetical protein [Tanacetum cinerariifolium]